MIYFFKKLKLRKINIFYKNIILIFLISSLLFGSYMFFIENISLIDTIYFLFVSATTIGYGDISPQTDIGRLLIIPYAILSLSSLGSIFGIISNYLEEMNLKNKKGEAYMKKM